jgi:hypothetical protein
LLPTHFDFAYRFVGGVFGIILRSLPKGDHQIFLLGHCVYLVLNLVITFGQGSQDDPKDPTHKSIGKIKMSRKQLDD